MAGDPTASHYEAFAAPLYVAWELTHRCNAQCIHCYSSSGPAAESSSRILPLPAALELVDELAAAGVLVLAFSGGEPLLHPHCKRVVERAVGNGLSVNVGTNGSTITPRNADWLRDSGVRSVTVSIDSHDPRRHDEFRKFEGLHWRAVTAVQRLVERGVRVVIGFTPTRLNWRDGAAVIELALSLGASAVNLSEFVPAGRGPIHLSLRPTELEAVLNEWIAARKQYRGRIEIMWHDCRVGLLAPEGERKDYLGCGAGRLVARITPDGAVTPCVFLPDAIGNVRDRPFVELWEHSPLLRKFRERKGHYRGNCGSCEHLATCGGCRAVAYAYSGGDALAGDAHCWVRALRAIDLPELRAGERLPL